MSKDNIMEERQIVFEQTVLEQLDFHRQKNESRDRSYNLHKN